MIEFNKDGLFRSYKDIVTTCINDGYALPYLLKEYNVPSKYCLSDNEKSSLFRDMSEDSRNNLYRMLKDRRKNELLIVKGEHSSFGTVMEFHEREVLNFLEVYPMFESILS